MDLLPDKKKMFCYDHIFKLMSTNKLGHVPTILPSVTQLFSPIT